MTPSFLGLTVFRSFRIGLGGITLILLVRTAELSFLRAGGKVTGNSVAEDGPGFDLCIGDSRERSSTG